ncbi:MAG: phage holin family protein [Verrucomicrobiaceae bacterium]|nr:MAG: phage holin family protein [Verrucomicrobiaceae bacterium]
MILLSIAHLIAGLFIREGMNEGTATFLGFLIVGLVVGAIGGALLAKGIKTLKNKSIAPEKTIETLKEDKAWAQRRFA